MPRVRLLAAMNVAGQSRQRGSECDVDPDVASYLLAQGRVVIVRGEQPETPERAAVAERTDRTRRRLSQVERAANVPDDTL